MDTFRISQTEQPLNVEVLLHRIISDTGYINLLPVYNVMLYKNVRLTSMKYPQNK